MAPRSITELQSIRRVLGLMAEGYLQGGQVGTITDADGQVLAAAN